MSWRDRGSENADKGAAGRQIDIGRDASGIVVLGDVHGPVTQLRERAGELTLPWRELHGEDIFNWLHWKTRLVPLVGRQQEVEKLLAWAEAGTPGATARLVHAPGGQGKTRLAAELAQELRERGWAAGFTGRAGQDGPVGVYWAGENGTLVVLDYPEENLERVIKVLRVLSASEDEHRLRVLLLSRRGLDYWQPVIDRTGATLLFTESPLSLRALDSADLWELFEEGHRALSAHVDPESKWRLGTTPKEFESWSLQDTEHRLPLFVLAAAAEMVLSPGAPIGSHTGPEAVRALVRREMTRLDNESVANGFPRGALARLSAFAAVSGGLGRDQVRRLADADSLELGLGEPASLWDRLQPTGRIVEGKIPAPAPDILAAALWAETFRNGASLAPEWVWAAVEAGVEGLSRLGRLIHDATVVLGEGGEPAGWLRASVENQPERAEVLRAPFSAIRLPRGLLPASCAVWTTLLEEAGEDSERALLLHNLSVDLAELGDFPGALAAIDEAVELYRQIMSLEPARHEAHLASSLNSLSYCLSKQEKVSEALAPIEEAVEVYRRLASQEPTRYEADLASSLNNLAVRLFEQGQIYGAWGAIEEVVEVYRLLSSRDPARYDGDYNNLATYLSAQGKASGALAAIEEAVEVYRQVSIREPVRYEAELASCLNNLSIYLPEQGQALRALEAIKEAVETYRLLSSREPARYQGELASSLNTLSNRFSKQGKVSEALEAIQKAVEIRRRLSSREPARYEADLASSVNTLSIRLSEEGKTSEALAAVEEAVEIRRRLSNREHARYEADLASSLNYLSIRLSEDGKTFEALAAVQEAVEIRRRLSFREPARYEAELASGLYNLSLRLSEQGKAPEAFAAIEEAVQLITPYADAQPDGSHAHWLAVMMKNLERQ